MIDFLFIGKYEDIATQHNCGTLKALFELIGRTSSIVSDVKESDIINAKYIILFKTFYTDDIKQLIVKHKKNIGFFVNDYVFGIEKIESISAEFKNNMRITLQEVDYCFCFNSRLKKELEKYNKNTFLLPLPILWDGLFQKFNVPLPQYNNTEIIRIGLISRPSHSDTLFNRINDVIISAGNKEIEIVYFSDKDMTMQIPSNIKLERHNFTSILMEFYKKIFSLKLNIIYTILPKDDIRLLYKTNLKFIEAAYMKIPLVVIDPTGIVYPEITNQQNGYSVKTREEARIALKELINNKELRINLGINANLYYNNKQPIATANLIYNNFLANIETCEFTDRTIRVLAIAEGNIPSTELLLTNPLTYLKDKGLITFDIVYAGNIIRTGTKIDFNKYNVILMLRLCSTEAFNLFLNNPKQQNNKLRFIYMIDDNFSVLNDNTPVGMQYKKINTALDLFIRNTNHVVVPSKHLYLTYLNKNPNVSLIRTFHDISKIDKLKQSINKNGIIIIGYAASIHHSENFKIVIQPLKQILQKYKNVRFECYFNGNVRGLEGLNVISHPAIIGLDNFYKHILSRGWDIGLAPLQFNEFNKSKSDNKYREYASFEIAGIYSDIECYDMIKNKENGILCKTGNDWFNAMEKLILNVEKRKRIVKNAYEDVKKIYDIEIVAEKYMKLFRGEKI